MKLSGTTIRKIGVAVVAGICVLAASGCNAADTIWADEVPSPDGRWLASARTVETSGFGTGDIETEVYLKWTKGSKYSEQVLGFDHDPRSASKTINLSMNWVAPTRLDVTYDGHATVELQVVKYGDVDISLQDLSKVPSAPYQLPDDLGIRIAPSPDKSR